jgi:hypothetical protein
VLRVRAHRETFGGNKGRGTLGRKEGGRTLGREESGNFIRRKEGMRTLGMVEGGGTIGREEGRDTIGREEDGGTIGREKDGGTIGREEDGAADITLALEGLDTTMIGREETCSRDLSEAPARNPVGKFQSSFHSRPKHRSGRVSLFFGSGYGSIFGSASVAILGNGFGFGSASVAILDYGFGFPFKPFFGHFWPF